MTAESSNACKWQRKRDLLEAARGTLPPDAAAAWKRHLAQCAACRSEINVIRKVVNRLESQKHYTARDPAALTERIITRAGTIIDAPAPSVVRYPCGQPLWRWAALFVLACTVFWLCRNTVWLQQAAKEEPAPTVPTPAKSVILAAHWLVTAQETDGRWVARRWQAHPSFETALNALALLTLSEAYRIAPDPVVAATVSKGVRALAERRDHDGRFGPFFAASHYNHAPATMALLYAGALGLESGTTLKPLIDDALQWIRQTQNTDGGWGYLDDAEKASNLAITYWNLEVLRTAGRLGWVDGTETTVRAARWVENNRAGNLGFGYQMSHQPQTVAATSTILNAMGIICLTGDESVDGARAAVRLQPAIEQLLHEAVNPEAGPDYYRDYLLAAALAQRPATAAAAAVTTVRNRVLRRQIGEGPLAGSWAPDDPWSSTGGRLYATAMAALTVGP